MLGIFLGARSTMKEILSILKQPNKGIKTSVHQQMSESKNCGTFIQWNTMQQKEGTPTFCDSMDGTGDYYAK